MGRPPRIHYPGALFHTMSRGNGGQPIFFEDGDWRMFLRILGDVKAKTAIKLYAYCLMPNHFHLLVEVTNIALETVMQRLLTRYSQFVNWRTGRKGHLFQARYKPILCDNDPYLLQVVRYIHLNPVRGGLVSDPVDWPWSGHREYLRATGPKLVDDELPLAMIGGREAYRRFVDEGRGMGHDQRFYRPAIPKPLPAAPPEPVLASASDAEEAEVRSFLSLAAEVSARTGVATDDLRGPSRLAAVVGARRQLVGMAAAQGFLLREIAEQLGRSTSTISRLLLQSESMGLRSKREA